MIRNILKTYRILPIILTGICLAPMHATATITTTDQLMYDTVTNLITSTGGQTYLGWNVLADLSYAETVEATSETGAFSNYHIANQIEAYEFYNSGNVGSDVFDTTSAQTHSITDPSYVEGVFGSNNSTSADFAFFLSDNAFRVGLLSVTEEVTSFGLSDSWGSFGSSDMFSAGGSQSSVPISWLVVMDVQHVPVPSAVWLMGAGLVGLLGFSRKKKAHVTA